MILLLLGAPWLLSMPATAAPKLGYIDVAKIMEEAPQAEAARTALEKEFKPRDEALAAERDAILKLEQRLSRDAEVISTSQREAMANEIRDRTRQFQRQTEAFKEDLNLRRNEVLAKLQQEIYQVILDVARQNSYDLVLTEAIFASDQVDMSDLVLRRLRQTYRP